MCKCCQSCLETFYWHCIEKKFCYDEEIALYEDTKSIHDDKSLVGYDNMAFYDNVALIAGRSIFTIEPLPDKKPIVQQPKKKLRWFEDEMCENHENSARSSLNLETVPEENDSVDTTDGPSSNTQDENLETNQKSTVELRKKSLPQRRMSKGLVLKIDNVELPVIRQSAIPKFYVDTPEGNQNELWIAQTPSIALTSPIRPQSHEFNYDLKSIVQIENERSQNESTDNKDSNRLSQIRSKLKPLKIKRTTSFRRPSSAAVSPRV